jgi:SGNH domain (fused to AT3 domains)
VPSVQRAAFFNEQHFRSDRLDFLMTADAPVQTASTARNKAARPGFRPEVQGLRALAVLMVVTYHVWLGRVSGGVDIFLLISAFLLTLSFVRKAESGKPLRLVQQYMAALGPIAKEHGWEVVTLLEGNCRFGADSPERNAECNDFNKASAAYVMEHRPDAVFTVASLTHKEAPFETEVPGYLEGIKPFTDAGIDVVGIRDNPRFNSNMPECVQKNGADAPQCNPPLAESLAASSPLDGYRNKVDGLYLMDLSDFLCSGGTCPAVVGNVYVYKDDNHLTKTYVQNMIPMFEQRLLAATGWT